MNMYVCLCPTCKRAQDYLYIYNNNRKEWYQQSENQNKMNIIEEKRGSGMDNEYIFALIENNPALYQCQ